MNMKYLLWISVNYMMLMPVFAFANDQSFSGVWSSREDVAGRSKPYSTFVIRIGEDNAGNISGSYCFVTRNGGRIDCSPDGENNLNGRSGLVENKARVSFYSFFGAVGGVAEIVVSGDRLLWNVVKQPQGGDYYGPLRAEMHRETSLGYRSVERKVVARKAFLYDSPSKSQVSRAYVVKGDSVRVVKISDNLKFCKIEFLTKNGRRLNKWIECSEIDFCAK